MREESEKEGKDGIRRIRNTRRRIKRDRDRDRGLKTRRRNAEIQLMREAHRREEILLLSGIRTSIKMGDMYDMQSINILHFYKPSII